MTGVTSSPSAEVTVNFAACRRRARMAARLAVAERIEGYRSRTLRMHRADPDCHMNGTTIC
jgi:hypothetical protein